jgi:hypothetical protein
MSAARRSVRLPAILLAAVAVPALVAGCGASGGKGGAAASSGTVSPAGSSSSAPGGSALAKGLLPAAAYGPQATVVGLDLEQLAHKAGANGGGMMSGGMMSALSGVTITPPACATALQALAPAVMGVPDAAAQTATGQGTTTVEALVSGGPAATGVATVKSLVAACGSAQARSPKLGSASVTVTELPVGSLGDAAEAVRVTATGTPAGRAAMTVPALAGVVQDGDRLLLLATVGTDGTPPDEAAFTALLQKAVSTEHAALD